jgi:hypothetical protein
MAKDEVEDSASLRGNRVSAALNYHLAETAAKSRFIN